jgi:hypothetical protein
MVGSKCHAKKGTAEGLLSHSFSEEKKRLQKDHWNGEFLAVAASDQSG